MEKKNNALTIFTFGNVQSTAQSLTTGGAKYQRISILPENGRGSRRCTWPASCGSAVGRRSRRPLTWCRRPEPLQQRQMVEWSERGHDMTFFLLMFDSFTTFISVFFFFYCTLWCHRHLVSYPSHNVFTCVGTKTRDQTLHRQNQQFTHVSSLSFLS